MKRLPLALIVALAVLATVPSFAAADRKSDEIRAYWTAERMRSATPLMRERAGKPVERAKPGTGGGGGSSSSWSTLAVTWPASDQRVYAHGKLFFKIGASNYVCSGTAVAASVVWTAGHCVNEGPGAYYSSFLFVPAYNSSTQRPYGEFAGVTPYTTDQWRTTSPTAYGYDLGAIKVGTNGAGETLGTALPALRSLDTSYSPSSANDTKTGRTLRSYGYPAASPYTGATEYVCDSYVSRRDASATPPDYGMPCGMNGGSSGGGWVDKTSGAVFSVNSYGYSSIKNTMFGPTMGAAAAALLTTAGG